MPKGNPNPKTEHFAEKRGQRPRLDNQTVAMRMSESTREALESIAVQYSCLYGGKPWIAGLLAKIGSGELLVLPAPPASPSASSSQHS
ncbi:MAG: hypothetical protein H7Y37_19790 [Anaerolineae bacterium]|nr:hypothetical protein [Gloeobacterales cyanobacterium ES-bin-313]